MLIYDIYPYNFIAYFLFVSEHTTCQIDISDKLKRNANKLRNQDSLSPILESNKYLEI